MPGTRRFERFTFYGNSYHFRWQYFLTGTAHYWRYKQGE